MNEFDNIDMSNPMIRQLVTGGITPNPKYNPKAKSKKDKAQPQYIKDTTPKGISGGIWDESATGAQAIHYDNNSLGLTPEEFSGYSEYGATPGPYKSIEDLNRIRANNQSAWEQTGRAVGQAVGNEIVLGTLLGLSNLVDSGVNVFRKNGENDYSNPISEFLEKQKESLKERLEIYREDPNATWAIDDFGWWADNSVSIASTLSMLIPSMAVTKGLSFLGKLGKLNKVSRGVAKAASAAKLTKTPGTLAKAINTGTEIGTAAFLSRTMEGYQEARGVYNEAYDKSLNAIKEMTIDEKNNLISRNPEFANMTDEEMAGRMAGLSADETFKNDYAMLLFDIAQFKALGSMWKGVVNKTSNASLRLANKNAIAQLVEGSADDVVKTGFLAKRAEAFSHALKNPLTSLGAIEFSEGIEEAYQGIQTEKGKEVAERILNPEFSTRSLQSYLTDGAIWEQAFWGILGGVGFQAAGTALGNLKNKVVGKYNKKRLSEEEYALTQMTDEKIREQEINSRKTLMQKFTDSMNLVNAGKNPFDYRLDPSTGRPIVESGSFINTDLDADQVERVKTQLVNDFVTNMTLNAVDKGNYDLFREFVKSDNFNKFFQQNGIDNVGDNSFSKLIINKMDEVNDIYSNALYNITNSIDIENENVAKLAARSIARRKLEINDLNDSVDELTNQILERSEGIDYYDYESKAALDYVKEKLDELDENDARIEKALADKQISEQAHKQLLNENAQRRNQLLTFANDYSTMDTDPEVADILKRTGDDRNLNLFRSKFNEFLAAQGLINNATPSEAIQNLIKLKIEDNDRAAALEDSIPKSQKAIQNEYNEIAMNVDRLTIERYNKAVDAVGEYIESQEDLDKAREDIITGNVPAELKESVEMLKLGHPSTEAYTGQLNKILKKTFEFRLAEEKAKKEVKVGAAPVTAPVAEKAKEEVDEVTEETDSREDEPGTSSTGEVVQLGTAPAAAPIDPTSFVPESQVTEEVDKIDKAAEDAQRKIAEQLIVDTDSRASGLASSITFNLFKTSRNLFNNLEGKDVNSAEFNRLVDAVEEELLIQGVSRGYARQASIDGIKMAMNTIARRLNSRGDSSADMFKRLADEIATKYIVEEVSVNESGEMNAVTKMIPDNQFSDIVDSFIQSYIANRGLYTIKGSKTIINVEDLFNEILSNPDISFEQAKHIFFNLSEYINAPINSKYVFTNKKSLNNNIKSPTTFFNELISSRATKEVVDDYMHMPTPTKLSPGYATALREASQGAPVTIGYFQGEKGSSRNSISIKRDGIEIGYLGSVVPNSTNTGYRLASQKKGFVYNINKNNNTIESNLDKLFIPLINKADDNFSKLMSYSYKQRLFELGEIKDIITIEQAQEILGLPIVKELIANGELLFPNDRVTVQQKAQYLLNNINNIIFYDNTAVTDSEVLDSYSYWKANTFNNYENTHKIQQALDSGIEIETRLVAVGQGKVLIDDVNHDVNSRGFTYEQNPIMVVDSSGNIVNETNNTSYNNVAGFTQGTMGMLVADNPKAPIIAMFTDANHISTNPELGNAVYTELQNLFTDFQNRTINFQQLGNSLADLFSGPGIKSNNLFSGYNVIRTNDTIALNIQGVKGQYSVIIHKFEKGTNREGTGITHIPNGDKTKAKSSINPNKTFINSIARELVNNLTFNKTFYAINNKNVDNDNSNQYIQKENGKLVVNIGNYRREYDSFGHFVLANNAFKTNQGMNADGTFFDKNDAIKSLYINTAIVTLPVEREQVDSLSTTAADLIKSATKDKGVSTAEVMDKVGVEKDVAELLTGKNEFGIELIPSVVYHDNKATVTNAYYADGKVYFATKGISQITKGPNHLIRLLMHEQIHGMLASHNTMSRDGIVTDLLNTYQTFIQEIDNDIYTLDKSSDKYKEAVLIKKWIQSSNFTPEGYFSKLSAEQQRYWASRSQEERDALFAEEWLVESLSQPRLVRYLNDTIYTGEDVSVEGIDNANKSIWQKLIDVILKLFGINNNNIKNNTILAKQYSILGNQQDAVAVTENDAPGDSPIEDVKPIVAPTERVGEEDALNRGTTKKRERRERFATTNLIEPSDTVDDAIAKGYRNSPDVNTNGVSIVNNMNDYINKFDQQDKPIIAKMVASNEVKFVCQ